jgi:hypothetical protein
VFTVKFESLSPSLTLSPEVGKIESSSSSKKSPSPKYTRRRSKKFVCSWKNLLIYDENEFQMELVNDSLSEFEVLFDRDVL